MLHTLYIYMHTCVYMHIYIYTYMCVCAVTSVVSDSV